MACEAKVPMSTDEILEQRGKTHGDFRVHAAVAQSLKYELKRGKNWEALGSDEKEALEMIVHKIGRILSGNPSHPDHWADIAGYARLIEKSIGDRTEIHHRNRSGSR